MPEPEDNDFEIIERREIRESISNLDEDLGSFIMIMTSGIMRTCLIIGIIWIPAVGRVAVLYGDMMVLTDISLRCMRMVPVYSSRVIMELN